LEFPANNQAQMTSFKSLTIDDVKEIKSKRELEKVLKDSGTFSQKSAAYIASMIRDEFDKHSGDTGNSKPEEKSEELSEIGMILKDMNNMVSDLRRKEN